MNDFIESWLSAYRDCTGPHEHCVREAFRVTLGIPHAAYDQHKALADSAGVEVEIPAGWMRDRAEVQNLADHLESIAWRPDSQGNPECYDQAAAMSNDVIRQVLLPMLDKAALRPGG